MTAFTEKQKREYERMPFKEKMDEHKAEGRKEVEELPSPKVGDRIATVNFYDGIGKTGVRLEGYSDPSKRLAWVKFDDGTTSGVPLKGMVRERDYPKTMAYKVLHDEDK